MHESFSSEWKLKKKPFLSFCLSRIHITVNPASLKSLNHSYMKTKLCCFLLALQFAAGLVFATTRTSATNDGVGVMESNLGSKQKECNGAMKGGEEVNEEEEEEAYGRGLSRIGSSPPSCEHKCYGCTPCEPIQVPTTSKSRSHLGINYANYEPEGWKCKCGPFFYSP